MGMVVAKTDESARDAAKWIQDNGVSYTPLPATINLDTAIEKKEFFYDNVTLPQLAKEKKYPVPSRIRKVEAVAL